MKPRFWIVLLAAGLFYVSTMARVSGYEKEHNRYNRLAAALAAKRLDIPVEPIPAMLTDPYNFALYKDEINRQKLDDLSVYKGKIFSYFSVVPVLVLYLPYRLVTGGRDLPEQIAVFVFGFGILVWAALLWARLRDRYFPEAPAWMDAAALGFLSLSNLVPFLIPNASVYIVAILSGLFFLTGAIYFLSPAPEISVPRLELGSLFLGLAAASRPNMIPLVLLLGSLTAYRLVRRAPADLLRRLAGLSVPCFACLGMVGVYNYARFGNPFEFGGTYQILAPNIVQSIIHFDPSRIVYNTYLFLFQSPYFDTQFPYVHGRMSFLANFRWPKGSYTLGGTSLGRLFPGIPFNYLLILCPIVYLAAREGLWTAYVKKGLLKRAMFWTAVYYFGLQTAHRVLKGLPGSTELALLLQRLFEEVPLFVVFAVLLCAVAVLRTGALLREAPPKPDFPRFPFLLLALSAGLILLVYLPYCQSAERYSSEFTTPVLLMTMIVWLYFDGKLSDDRFARWTLRALGLFLGTLSALFGVAYSFARAF